MFASYSNEKLQQFIEDCDEASSAECSRPDQIASIIETAERNREHAEQELNRRAGRNQ